MRDHAVPYKINCWQTNGQFGCQAVNQSDMPNWPSSERKPCVARVRRAIGTPWTQSSSFRHAEQFLSFRCLSQLTSVVWSLGESVMTWWTARRKWSTAGETPGRPPVVMLGKKVSLYLSFQILYLFPMFRSSVIYFEKRLFPHFVTASSDLKKWGLKSKMKTELM